MHKLREKFMERLLREIFQRKGSGFVLKGGAALRSIYGEHRYTKDIDLDFTNPHRTADSLHNTLSSSIANAARALAIRDIAVSKPGKGERSPRWKINFSDATGKPVHVEVEVSRDEKRRIPGQIVVQAFKPQADRGIARFYVDIYDQQALIASKLAALFGRGLPRDVYDLDVLHVSGEAPDADQVRWALKSAKLGGQNPEDLLYDRMNALTWDRFETELMDSLVASVAERIDESEWESLKGRVTEYVVALLEQVNGVA
jgi:predicted nucleotidyltransferase component of viral defense system